MTKTKCDCPKPGTSNSSVSPFCNVHGVREFNSRDMLNELKQEMDVRNPAITLYNAAVMEALQARVNNELEVTQQLSHALALMPCYCQREYPYHGKGVYMCVRCRALVLWETLTQGESEIQANFDKEIPR